MTKVDILFHPVGQGLFSSGHIRANGSRFDWTYDCGSDSPGKLEDEAVDRLWHEMAADNSMPILDFVFISHFDLDHISGIPHLLRRFRVEELVVPLVPLWRRLLLVLNVGSAITHFQLDFLLDPIGAIARVEGANVGRILLVPPRGSAPSVDGAQFIDDIQPSNRQNDLPGRITYQVDLENSNRALPIGDDPVVASHPPLRVMKQGGRIRVDGFWEFLPYNDALYTKKVDSKFVRKANQIRVRLLQTQSPTIRNLLLQVLKRHYERKFISASTRNGISLFVYAGLVGANGTVCACDWPVDTSCFYPTYCIGQARGRGFLFTGDGDLKAKRRWKDLETYMGKYRAGHLLALQVMHHGSKNNWHPGLAQSIAAGLAVFAADPAHKLAHPDHNVLVNFSSQGPTALVDKHTGCRLQFFF